MSKIIENDRINLGLLFFKIKKAWWMFAILVPLFAVGGYFYAQSLEKVFGFKGSLLLSPNRTGAKKSDELLGISNIEKGINTDDEIGVITSYDMIKMALQELDFGISYYTGSDYPKNEKYKDFPIEVIIDSANNQLVNTPIYVDIINDKEYRIRIDAEKAPLYNPLEDEVLRNRFNVKLKKTMRFGRAYRSDDLSFVVNLKGDPKMYGNDQLFFAINYMDGLVKTHRRKLNVEPAKRDSYLIEIRTQGTNTEKNIDFINKLMEVVIADNRQDKNQVGENTIKFIDDKLEESKKLLRQSEIEYKSYQAEHRLMGLDIQSQLATQGIDKLFDERISTQLRKNAYQNVNNALASSQGGDQITSGSFSLKDNYVTTQLNNLSKLQQDRASRITNLTPDHPSIIALDQQIQTSKSQLREFLKQSIKEADGKLFTINQRINEYKNVQSALPIEDKQLNELARRFNNDRENYEKLLDRRFEAQIGLETNTPDIKIIEEAKKERDAPIKPNKKFIYLFSLILGFGFPMGFILLTDMINNKVQSKQDIRDATKIPFLGMIADGGKKHKLLALDRPKSLASESFRSIRLGLEDAMKGKEHQQVIGITSTIDGEGKTYCAINLGLSYAVQEYKTLLVVADLYKDQLHKYFPVSGPGLTQYLKGEASFGEVTKDTPSDHLHVIPSGELPKSPSAIMRPEKIAALLEEARVHYDKIIIDIPPIGYVSDYFNMENSLDATVYLIRYNYSSKKLLEEISEQYDNKRVNQVYVVLNYVKFSSMYEFEFKNKKHSYYQKV